ILGLPVAALCIALFLWAMTLMREGARQGQMLAAALERNTLLLGEVHHRVKNNLATVSALINIQPLPAGARQALVARISAIAAVHEGLYGTDRLDRIALADYLGRQIKVLQASHGDGVRVEHDLAEVEVGQEAAMPLGLIINEVLSNAFKHAFPDGRRGLVSVKLEQAGPGSARLEIRDNGIGRRVPPQGGGMGSRLIHGLSQQIGADYAYSLDEGTVFTLVFPLAPAGE
ncbi:MAG: sensor histidine kinase, partial [Acetobacterales bacterium]